MSVPRWLWFVTALHAVAFAAFSSLNVLALKTNIDFAGAQQGMWQLAFGPDQFNTVFGAHNFVNHFYGAHLTLAPLFRLWPSPHLLKWVQVFAVAGGAPVVFRLAWARTRNPALAGGLALLYLLHPVVINLSLGDYYGIFAVPLLLLLLLDQVERSPRCALLLTLATLACQENLAPTVLLIGAYVALKHNRRLGVTMMLLAIGWLTFLLFWMIPHLNQGYSTPHLAVYAIYGETPAEILRTLCTRPAWVGERMLIQHSGLSYLGQLIGTAGGACLLAPELLLLQAADFLINFLPTYDGSQTFGRHYGVVGLAVSMFAAAEGLARAQRWLECGIVADADGRTRALVLLLMALALPISLAHSGLRSVNPGEMLRAAFAPQAVALRRLLASLPPEAGVATEPNLLLHLARRPVAYALPNPWRRQGWNGQADDPDYGKYIVSAEATIDLTRGEDVDYVVVTSPGARENPFDENYFTGALIKTGRYRLWRKTPQAVVLQRIVTPVPTTD